MKITLDELLKKYLYEIKHFELAESNNNIQFLYDAKRIEFEEKTTIDEYFSNKQTPIILVIDKNNLLYNKPGAKMNVNIQNTCGYSTTIVFDYGKTVDLMLKINLYKVNLPNLIGDKPICFSFKSINY